MAGPVQTVLLTGGNGFIGRNIVEQLGPKYKLLAPSRQELNLLDETAVERYFSDHPVDVVIHAANIGGLRRDVNRPVAADNLRIFFNIVRCERYFGRMISFGSGAELDKRCPIRRARESDFGVRVPSDEYGFYKYICSQYILRSEKVTALRIFAVFGKYENAGVKFISHTIGKAVLGLPLSIHRNAVFDYLYIDDFIQLLDRFLNHSPKERIYNIGRGEPIDLLTIAQKINAMSGKKLSITIGQEGWSNEYTCDNTKLVEELGGFTFMPFDESLRRLYAWYEANMESLPREWFEADR